MSRQPLLPCAWLSVAFGLAVAVAPVPGWSQDRSTQERLDRLERGIQVSMESVRAGSQALQHHEGFGEVVSIKFSTSRSFNMVVLSPPGITRPSSC